MSFIALLFVVAFGQSHPAGSVAPPVAPVTPPAAHAATPTDEPQPSPESPATRARSDPNGPGAWLVHLARHHGHLLGRTNPRAVTLQVLAMMQAAAAVQPDLAEPYLWQFDLYGRLNRPDDALAALGQYVRRAPDDESAALMFLDRSLAKLQTAEARTDYIRKQLSQPNLPRSVASDLHRRLAEHFRERRDIEEAGKQIENALRLMPSNVSARQLSYDLFGETEPALQRVELALQLIAASPGQINLLWELGEMLDSLSMHRPAQEWYQRAIELNALTKTAVPPLYWYQLALSYSNSADYKEALEAVDKALAADPTLASARILKSHIAGRLNRPDADAPLDALAQQYDAEAEKVLAARNVARAGELAWFYAYHRPNKQRALALARLATSVPDSGSLARRAFGYALLLDSKYSEALAQLRPLADEDQLAAVGAARALIGLHKEPEAVAVLNRAAHLAHTGLAADAIAELLAKLGQKPPEYKADEKILEALKHFDRRIFDFLKRPGDFLKFSLRWVDESLPTAGPWRVVARLENTAHFPITLGPGLMVQPVVLFSARCGDGPGMSYDHYMQLLMNRRPVLVPGDAVEVATTIDVGPLREYLLSTCSTTQQWDVSALLDPEFADGTYKPGPQSIASNTLVGQRAGLPRDREGTKPFMLAITDPASPLRLAAIDELCARFAEIQNMKDAKAEEKAMGPAIRDRLLSLLADRDWLVRAHLIAGLCGCPSSPEILSKVSGAIYDENSVVRLMAVRFFALQQGPKFRKVLGSLAESDPDQTVRMIARSYVSPS